MTFQYPPITNPPSGASPPAVGDLLYYDGTAWVAAPAASIPGDYTDSAPLYGASVTTYQGALDALKTWAGLPALGTVAVGNVTMDAYPHRVYPMAPTANRTFDPTAAAVAGWVWVVKTTTSTNKISLKATVGWNYMGAGDNTAYDLVGSATNSASAPHAWLLLVNPVAGTVQVVVGVVDMSTLVPNTITISGGTGLTGGGDLSANRTLTPVATITDPPAASTGNVTIDATSTPRFDYYMAPAGNQTFDPTAATVSQRVTITKTTTSTNKITLPATALWTYFPSPGTAATALDLPQSATNSATANHQWTLTIDVPNKTVYVAPIV